MFFVWVSSLMVGRSHMAAPIFSAKHAFFSKHEKLDGGTACEKVKRIPCSQCCNDEGKLCNLGFWCENIELMRTYDPPSTPKLKGVANT